ncbi:pilZ domain containing protein [Synechococcus sp. RS9909]|nr:hypothetical protein RS9917_10821 [Synechococcus sp. RS9917]QNI79806.1 pilZ domain containing protein [Synechococcus sp. RS9909]
MPFAAHELRFRTAIAADLLDLGEGGACLAIANECRLQPGDQAQLRIPSTTGESELHRVWVRWRDDDAEMIAALGVQWLRPNDAPA